MNKKTFFIIKMLLVVSALGILFISYFYYQPGHDPTSTGLAPRLAQTLVCGGSAVLMAIYTWFWPIFGGITSASYGLYMLFGHPFGVFGLNDPLARNLFTLAPVPVYYTIYGIFLTAAILCIVIGWKHRKVSGANTGVLKKLKIVTFRISLGLVAGGILYGLMVFSMDYLIGCLFWLISSVFILMWISGRWPAQGGLLEIMAGISWLVLGMTPYWGRAVYIPYIILCSLLIVTGLLNIARGYRIRYRAEVEA